MSSLNKVSLIGRIGVTPESRFMSDGTQVSSISMATTETWKDKEGNKQERTEWHNVIFFAGLADVVCEYLEKGAKVYVEGKLRTRKWTDKQETERHTTEIIARELIMLDKKAERYASFNTDEPDDPDIPF